MQKCVRQLRRPGAAMLVALIAILSGFTSLSLSAAAADNGAAARASAPDSAAGNSQVPEGAQKCDLLPNQPPLLVWNPPADAPSKGVVLCMHELGMNSAVFADLGRRLSSKGYIVYAMDERGFGGWENVKGPEARMNIDRILADIKSAAQALHKKHDGMPVFLLGEAMGGTLVLKAAASNPDLIQGTISSAPGGEHFNATHNYMRVCKHLITAPSKRFAMGKDLIASGTAQKDQQDYFENEAKVRINLAPKEMMDCQFFMYKARNFAQQIKTTPVMIVQGDKDGMTKPISAQHVYDSLSTNDKKLMMLPDGDHYVYEGKHVNDTAMKDTLSWLDSHLPTR